MKKVAKHITRYIEQPVTEDVKRKMVFIGGPRQQAIQLTLDEDMDLMTKEGIRICSSHLFLKDLV